MLAREIATALGMTESPDYAAKKVREVLRSNSAFVEISRGRWQLGQRLLSVILPLPHDQQQEWMQRAFDHLMKAAVARAAAKMQPDSA